MDISIRNMTNKDVAVLDAIAKDRNISRNELLKNIVSSFVLETTSTPSRDLLTEVVADNTVALKAIVDFLIEREEKYNEMEALLSRHSLRR